MRKIINICDECKKRKAVYRARAKIEKLSKDLKIREWSFQRGIFCQKCARDLAKGLSELKKTQMGNSKSVGGKNGS